MGDLPEGERPASCGVVCVVLTLGGDAMRVSRTMCLGQLAELMGQEATQREAELMREFLVDECYDDTEAVQESEWLEMVRDAVELAEAETSDGGPTQSDLRGEVDHG